MAKLRVYVENGGNIYNLINYQKEAIEREIQEEIRMKTDQKIRKERARYSDAFENSTIAFNIGKRTGLQIATKALRGICG